MPKKLTTKQFIEKARKVHGNKYDYTHTVYNLTNEDIIFHCPKHGLQIQLPLNHLSGRGCKTCGRSLTTEKFVEKARKIHGNKYDYSKVDYFNTKTKVTILCSKHGEFKQEPSSHLMGANCPQCARSRSGKPKLTTEQFVEKAKQKHGKKYHYSKTNYLGFHKKLTITCPRHGDFIQRAHNHLKGSGCKLCAIQQNKKISTSQKNS